MKSNQQNQHTIYQHLLHQKRQRKAACELKRALGKQLGGGLEKVAVIKNREHWELTNTQEIEEACHKENKAKFTQTNDTPSMKGQLMRDLGFLDNSAVAKIILQGNALAESILQGSYQSPSDLDEYSKSCVAQLKRKPDLKDIPKAEITTDGIVQD